MGPQHESCGKSKKWIEVKTGTGLQWGRNMRVAESMRDARKKATFLKPSMGPQHESCGKSSKFKATGLRALSFNGAAT